MKILVLGGGTSPEREISLLSAAAVRDSLTKTSHAVTYMDAALGDDEILAAARETDLIMPILHGPGGEDGEIQALLERSHKPYLGADVAASRLCINKVVIKEMLLEHGLPTAKFAVVTKWNIADSKILERPFVLKPVDVGSSVGLLVAKTLPYDQGKVDELFAKHNALLLEEYVEGVEITVPILGDEALPVIEIVPPSGQEFDYENKYNGSTTEFCPPKNVSLEIQAEAKKIAMQIHKLAGIRHLSRTDMIVRPDGALVVLEINTMPGMTAQSLYPKAALAAGLSFDQLVAKFVEMATN